MKDDAGAYLGVPVTTLQSTFQRAQRYINAAKREIELTGVILSTIIQLVMPLKWKVYYWCMFYLLLWGLVMFIFISKQFFHEAFYIGVDENLKDSILMSLTYLLCILFVLAFIFKPFPDIQDIDTGNSITFKSKRKKKLFVASFCILIVFSLFSLFIIILSTYFNQWPGENFFSNFSFIVACICTLYLSITDFIWLRTSIYKSCRKLFLAGKGNFIHNLITALWA